MLGVELRLHTSPYSTRDDEGGDDVISGYNGNQSTAGHWDFPLRHYHAGLYLVFSLSPVKKGRLLICCAATHGDNNRKREAAAVAVWRAGLRVMTGVSLPVPAAEKHAPQHDAATTMLHCRDGIGLVMSGAWFPPNMTPGINAKEFNLCLIRPENFVSHGLRGPSGLIGGLLQRWLSFWKVLLSLQRRSPGALMRHKPPLPTEAYTEKRRLQEEQDRARREMEEEKLRLQQLKDTVKVAEVGAEKTEDEVKTIQSPLLDETAAILTNGKGHLETNTNHNATEQSNTTNGPTSESAINMKESELSLGVSEAEPGEVLNVDINEDEEEGTVVMRAERVIITDEEDDLPEELTPQEYWQEAIQSEESPLLNPDTGKEGGEAVEEVVNAETAPEAFTQPEESEATKPTAEAQPPAEEREMEDVIKTNENGDEETKAEEQDQPSEDPTSVQVHLPADALEGAPRAPVPVYSEAQLSTLTLQLQAEGEATTSPEGAEAALKAQEPASEPGQFQDVPLADPQENQRDRGRASRAGIPPVAGQSPQHPSRASSNQ
ncbi:hypothetical protein L3Q82_005411 [Scortum barcoo]|uniref:Uncharacterized protein n=1 Tax=Scortum barcoo TaxID=214431 RepID=A0ACB8V9Y2_9TELE|nr:hypothetical protein L3Q82_005411 [Scortum barcoo]